MSSAKTINFRKFLFYFSYFIFSFPLIYLFAFETLSFGEGFLTVLVNILIAAFVSFLVVFTASKFLKDLTRTKELVASIMLTFGAIFLFFFGPLSLICMWGADFLVCKNIIFFPWIFLLLTLFVLGVLNFFKILLKKDFYWFKKTFALILLSILLVLFTYAFYVESQTKDLNESLNSSEEKSFGSSDDFNNSEDMETEDEEVRIPDISEKKNQATQN